MESGAAFADAYFKLRLGDRRADPSSCMDLEIRDETEIKDRGGASRFAIAAWVLQLSERGSRYGRLLCSRLESKLSALLAVYIDQATLKPCLLFVRPIHHPTYLQYVVLPTIEPSCRSFI